MGVGSGRAYVGQSGMLGARINQHKQPVQTLASASTPAPAPALAPATVASAPAPAPAPASATASSSNSDDNSMQIGNLGSGCTPPTEVPGRAKFTVSPGATGIDLPGEPPHQQDALVGSSCAIPKQDRDGRNGGGQMINSWSGPIDHHKAYIPGSCGTLPMTEQFPGAQ